MTRSRAWFYGSGMATHVIVVAGLFALANYLSANHYTRIDLTAGGKYSLSPQTEKVLSRLSHDIRVIGFVKDDDSLRARPRRLLQQFASAGRHFLWEFSDPDKQPNIARSYNVTQYNTFVVADGEKRETLTGEMNEERLTNAIIRLISTREHVIYFTVGHGEKSIASREPQGYDGVRAALAEQSFKVKELPLFNEAHIPDDASALVIAGAEKGFGAAELKKVEDYLLEGGKALILLDPFTAPELAAWLPRFGVEPESDIIVDTGSRLVGGEDLSPAVISYQEHPITRGFRLMTIFPLALSMKVKSGASSAIASFELVRTRADTWGKTDEAEVKNNHLEYKEGKDLPGPLILAAGARITKPATEGGTAPRSGAVVVFGDSDFAANAYLNLGGNRDLFMNTLNWLAAEEDRITIASRAPAMDPFIFSTGQIVTVAGIGIVGLPLMALVAGVWINLRRRRS